MALPQDDSEAPPPPAAAEPGRQETRSGPREVGEATGSGRPDRVTDFVADIRQRLAEIAARELGVQRRERDLVNQHRRIEQSACDQARQELDDARAGLEARAAEFDAQTVELTARRARLAQLESRLNARVAEQERAEQGLQRSLQQARAKLVLEREQLLRDRQTLRGRIALIRQMEQALTQRVKLAHENVQRQRAELDDARAELEQKGAQSEERRRLLESRRSEWEQRLAAREARAAEMDQQQTEVLAERSHVEEHRQLLAQTRDALDLERQGLAETQRELDENWRSTRQQRQRLKTLAEEVEARRRVLQQEQAALDERTRGLVERESRLREKEGAIESELRRLEEAEVQLTERQAEIDQLHEQTTRIESDARARGEESAALREQSEARDAQSRQSALALELERAELQRERAALARAQQELSERREPCEREIELPSAAATGRAPGSRAAERGSLTLSGGWWLRSTVVATVAAGLAAAAWLVWHPPQYRGVTKILIAGAGAATPRLAAEHAATVPASEIITAEFSSPDLRRAWTLARSYDGVQATAMPDGLELAMTLADGALAVRLAQAAARAYVQHANQTPGGPQVSALCDELRAVRASAAGELEQLRQEQLQLTGGRPETSGEEEPAPVRGKGAELRTEYGQVAAALPEARAALTALASAPPSGGTVDPGTFEQSLAGDAVYQEDRKEYRGEAQAYQVDLAVQMVLAVDPVKVARESLREFQQVLAEQRGLRPPPAVSAVLEETETELGQFDNRLTGFLHQWDEWRLAIERTKVDQDVVELVQLHDTVHEAIRQLVQAAQTLVSNVDARIARMSETSGGTREVVVAAVMRGSLTRLNEKVGPLGEAAGTLDPQTNFRLDAHDRQLRGLRTRLNERRELLHTEAQNEVDRHARQQHEERQAQAREAVRGFEQRREELLKALLENQDVLQQIEADLLARRHLEAQLGALDAQAARLETEIERLDAAMAELRESGADSVQLKVAESRVEPRVGVHRYRDAGLAGAGVFSGTWLISLLTVSGPLWRRRTTTQALPEQRPRVIGRLDVGPDLNKL